MTYFKRKWLIILAAGIVLALGAGAYWYFQSRDFVLPVGEDEEIHFHFRLGGNEVVGWSRGEMLWRIKVQTIIDPEEERDRANGEKLILQDIEEGYFYREGEVYITFTVDEAHYFTRTEDLQLFGVRLERPGGDWLKSDEMTYSKADETLHSPVKVIGKMGRTDIEAEQMTALLDREEIIFDGGVKMIHQLEVE